MNTHPNAKQIMIYGDSLVYGKKPLVPERFGGDTRFTGIIQCELGENFEIIEEGLRARNLAGENPFFKERNGLEQFGPIYGSHVPLDLVILMLGTNDCNRAPEKSEKGFELALDGYIEKIVDWNKQLGITQVPKILLVAPPLIRSEEAAKNENITNIFGPDSEERTRKLEATYAAYATKHSLPFFAASSVCAAAENEGIHLDVENNERLGKGLAEVIRKLLL